ncbi:MULTISPECIES: outer membrane protein assembly factor BamE [unclassified Roseivivax]|uniref:outer membrane protein assembly factor BamE n=1 Tax=Roseivivax sp. GX 12232 TaxID=2900547 RepID=UPI001E479B41|nr:outer membrane protein assembly factor BamE [Roseivivax sp. GX 12232]MCE0504648.1 outer membrane protein assembly factor BamE [Roseivivax sp. GX 12232]
MSGSHKRATGKASALLSAAMLMLAACSADFRNHGYVPPEEDLQAIVPGIDTRATVEETVGVPTASGVLSDSAYYWVGSTMRHFAWQRPEVVEREVVAISFSEAGVVSNIERYGLEDGRVVPISRRVTASSGGDISFIRKLFGNIGSLNPAGLVGE